MLARLKPLIKDRLFWLGLVAFVLALNWASQRHQIRTPLVQVEACLDTAREARSIERRLIRDVIRECTVTDALGNTDNPCLTEAGASAPYVPPRLCRTQYNCLVSDLRKKRAKYPEVKRAQELARQERRERMKARAADTKAQTEEGLTKLDLTNEAIMITARSMMLAQIRARRTLNAKGFDELEKQTKNAQFDKEDGLILRRANRCARAIL